MPERTVLLIDYDPESIESARRTLTEEGYRLEVAGDGVAGLAAFDRLRPDLVLIEPMVPKKHGFQVCQEIKRTEHGKTVPVVITTAFYKSRKHRLEARDDYGCDDYLIKPIGQEQLLATCRKFFPPARTDDPAPARPGGAMIDVEAAAMPWAPPREQLPALDELSDDELGARLDEMILEEPEDVPAEEAPAPEPMAEPAPVPVAAAAEESPGAVVTAPPPAAPPRPAPRRVAARSAPPPPAPVASPPVEVRDAPEPVPASALKPSPDAFDTPGVSPPPIEVRDSPPEARAPAPVAPAPPRPAVRSVPDQREALPPSPARTRAPVWIAAAGVALIAVGGGILWKLGGETERPAGRSDLASSSPSRVSSAVPPTPAPAVSELALPDPTKPESPDPREPRRPGPTSEPTTGVPAPRVPSVERASSKTRKIDASRPSRPGDQAASVPPKPAAPPPITTADAETDLSADAPQTSPPIEAPATPPEAAPSARIDPPETEAGSAGPEPIGEGSAAIPILVGAFDSIESAESKDVDRISDSDRVAAPPNTPAVERGQLVDLSAVDREPEPVARPTPAYPAIAKKLRLQGTVVLRLLIDENGNVAEVEVDKGVDRRVLDRAAVDAVRRWRYTPAEKDGVAVRVWIPERVSFKL